LNELCKLIDRSSLGVGPAELKQSQNTVIYEALSYLHNTFLPTLLNPSLLNFFQKRVLQEAVLNLLDIISLRYEAEP
jgi:hypothetical protein